MFNLIRAAVAALVLTVAGQASAATTYMIAEGTAVNGSLVEAGLYIPDHAVHAWEINFIASAPIDRIDYELNANKHFHYEYDNPLYDYGNEFDYPLPRTFTLLDNGFRIRFDMPYDYSYRFDDPEFGYDYWEAWALRGSWVSARVWPGDGATATYKITMTAVPEPTTWALMIVGFGLTGAFARRRRQRYATSVCSSPLSR